MLDKYESTPIQLLAEALAEMTERAVQAERERDAAKKDAETWYQSYCKQDERIKELEMQMCAEIDEHQKTKDALREALDLAAERSKAAAAKSKKKGA